MKTWSVILAAAVVAAASYSVIQAATGKEWTTSYKQALATSKQTGKPIMADFTGSDWCGYCIKQDQEVFSTKQFKEWAAKNVVPLTLDFPHGKKLPADLQKQNEELKAKFRPNGFPTLVFIDASGNEIGRAGGYSPGSGFDAWKQRMEGVLKKGSSGQ